MPLSAIDFMGTLPQNEVLLLCLSGFKHRNSMYVTMRHVLTAVYCNKPHSVRLYLSEVIWIGQFDCHCAYIYNGLEQIEVCKG